MVRGNWQHRVERTIERREKARNDKQRFKQNRQHKLNVQELIRFLDKLQQQHNIYQSNITKYYNNNHNNVANHNGTEVSSSAISTITLHLWTDTIPSNTDDPNFKEDCIDDEGDNDDDDDEDDAEDDLDNEYDMDEDDVEEDGKRRGGKNRNKGRSQSFGSPQVTNTPNTNPKSIGRNRSKSITSIDDNNDSGNDAYEAKQRSRRSSRSNSISDPPPTHTGKKKVHPRSNQKSNNISFTASNNKKHDRRNETELIDSTTSTMLNDEPLYMSRSSFFSNSSNTTTTGKRNSSLNKNNTTNGFNNGLAFNGIENSINTTMYSVVTSNNTRTLKESVRQNLYESELAAKESFAVGSSLDTNRMERMFYSEIVLDSMKQQPRNDDVVSNVHDIDSSSNHDDDDDNDEDDDDDAPPPQSTATTTTTVPSNNNTPPSVVSSILFSTQVTDLLAKKQMKISSIAYVVLLDVILFDKNRQGLLYNDVSDFWSTVNTTEPTVNATVVTNEIGSPPPSSGRLRKSSIDDTNSKNIITNPNHVLHKKSPYEKQRQQQTTPNGIVKELSGEILEQILTYLPDTAVGAACCVCKPWSYEIGKKSPHLWQYLLKRRGWPQPQVAPLPSFASSSTTIPTDSDHHLYRDQFIQHYTVMRDVKAIESGIRGLLSFGSKKSTSTPTNKSSNNRTKKDHVEMTYMSYSDRRYSPKHPNTCIGVQTWSKNRVLVGYKDDCSLRLYEAGDSTKPGVDEISCRELVCQKIDPYWNTKKRTCSLLSIALDEECIGSLCRVVSDSIDNVVAFILVIMRRDNFLLGESCGPTNKGIPDEDTLDVIDIGEAVINYLSSSDVGDHRLLRVLDFISGGGEIGDIEVLAAPTILSAGYGRFMVEVSISLPAGGGDDQYNPNHEMVLVDRKMILFSTRIGAIVWMGDSGNLAIPAMGFSLVSCQRRPVQVGGSHTNCYIAVAAGLQGGVTIQEIDYTGTIHDPIPMEAPSLIQDIILSGSDESWTFGGINFIMISRTDVIVVQQFLRNNNAATRSSLLFLPHRLREEVGKPTLSYQMEHLPFGMSIRRMVCIRDNHLVLICDVVSTPFTRENLRKERMRKDYRFHNYENSDATESNSYDNYNLDETDRSWIAGQDSNGYDVDSDGTIRASVEAVIVHIPSRTVIGRRCLLEERIDSYDITAIPVIPSHCDETIGVGLSWMGFVMTGANVRSVRWRSSLPSSSNSNVFVLDDASTKQSKKKANSGKPKKNGGKKDGFARGMSLRG